MLVCNYTDSFIAYCTNFMKENKLLYKIFKVLLFFFILVLKDNSNNNVLFPILFKPYLHSRKINISIKKKKYIKEIHQVKRKKEKRL